MRDEKKFFEAWRKAVKIIGPQYFGPLTPDQALTKNDLRPNEKISRLILKIGHGEAQFVISVVSFYNDEWAELMGKKLRGAKSVCGLVGTLDSERRGIIADLINYYPGW